MTERTDTPRRTGGADTFTCDHCGGTWEKGWSDEEADAEYQSVFGAAVPKLADRAVVCDDCYAAVMEWLGDSQP